MKVSTRGRYGLTIMMELARRYGEGPTSLRMIAQKHDLSEHYLEQLVAPLRNAGLVKSVRGAHGGYMLAREPERITAGDILRVLEGPLSPIDEEEDDPAKRELWMRIHDKVTEVLDTTTLADLLTFGKEGDEDYYMLYI
ncbi:MAG: Rrf2 family transcriptional regulator [Bacillota bacterium]|nr:transcriptional regulator [Bacillota bacterium]